MSSIEIQLQRAKRILEISYEMTSTVSLQSLLKRIVEAAVELTDGTSAGILLAGDSDNELRFVIASDSAGALAGIPVPIDHSIAGYVFTTGEPLIVPDVRLDPRYYDSVAQQVGIVARSLLAVPLQFTSRRVGVLEVENKRDGQQFCQEDVETLTSLASYATIAIENAQLYQQLEQHRDHLRELVKARTAELEAAVSEAQSLNLQLEKEIEEREVLIADLKAFSHTVAHDLKNPLTLIVGYVSMLMNKPAVMGEAELMVIAGPISRTANRMIRIIDGILTLANVGREEIIPEPLDMSWVIEAVEDRLALLVNQHQAVIIKPESWPPVLGYAQWLEEVWANYISNAIKYGGRPPRIELGADPPAALTADGGEYVRFWVRDNGPGLPEDVQPQLFMEFARFDETHTGYGLGLSIVKRIVTKLGGQVGIESPPGHGSLFYFTLPAFSQTEFVPET
jgi:signal transduction histidine kinase